MQSRGILTALRAAAVVIIATGLNDVLAGALPRYEPLYLYLAAVALVVLLDGLFLGALTAIGAIAFYALLFMPRPAPFSKAALVPFGAALATLVVASIVRGILRVRTRKVAVAERLAPPTPLLMPPIVIDHGEVLSAIDELRGELRSALSEVSQEDPRVAELQQQVAEERALRERLELDAQSRDAELAAERARVAALESELATERAASDQKLNTIMVHLAQDHEADLGKAVEEREEARAEARSMAMRAAGLQKKLEEQRLALDDATRLLAETRAAAQQEIDTLHARVQAVEKPAVLRPRILIAHPDADLRRNAGASLERAGYEIVSAADGLEALRTAIAQSPAVVIADAIMPKMDGRELCQLLKSQQKTAHIRVILLTRSTDTPAKGDLMPDEVLRKPVPLETLKTTLAALLA